MHGNVAEWCLDWLSLSYYEESPSTDPLGPESGSFRVFRGGNYGYSARGIRSASRDSEVLGFRYDQNGFRLLRRVMEQPVSQTYSISGVVTGPGGGVAGVNW